MDIYTQIKMINFFNMMTHNLYFNKSLVFINQIRIPESQLNML